MNLSKKDQSFILLIVAVVVIFYSLYSLFSYLFFSATFNKSAVSNLFQNSSKSQEWFNTSRPLEISDLKDRVILLNFWNYDCVDCDYISLKIKKLEQIHGNRLTVIGVHSNKSEDGDSKSQIIKSIVKNNIIYPVVNDDDLKISNSFDVKKAPALILMDIHGKIRKTYDSEKEIAKLENDVKKLITKFKYRISYESLPLFFEKNSVAGNVLNFPSKILYVKYFKYKTREEPALIVANSGDNNIIVSNLSGEVIVKIGSEAGGFTDGSFEESAFNSPRGILYDNGKLYVSDTGNNALRQVDFGTEKVTTLLGILGNKGEKLGKDSVDAEDFDLSTPGDIEFFPNHETIAIANLGTNQILSYNIRKQKISVLVGNGSEGKDDGKYPNNSTSLISDISSHEGKLYFTDAKAASLRVVDESLVVKTLVNGQEVGNLTLPTGLTVDGTGAYISDASNNVVKKYDFNSGKLTNFIGSKKKGDNIGSASTTELDEPNGIIATLNDFYIADSGNNRILSVVRGNMKVDLLDVLPPLKFSKEGFLEYLPNMQKAEGVKVAADKEIKVEIEIEEGWKINEKGPSFINLLEIKGEKQANLLASFDWNAVKAGNIKLSKLPSGKNYALQGVIYYCEDKQNALCYVKSYEQNVAVESDEKNDKITVKLDY
ncbi:MAG: redoxin domain-containing protein [Rickettsiales bacterium]|nr:redoxin domain-containing protein [Rickettsiales bacterium]